MEQPEVSRQGTEELRGQLEITLLLLWSTSEYQSLLLGIPPCPKHNPDLDLCCTQEGRSTSKSHAPTHLSRALAKQDSLLDPDCGNYQLVHPQITLDPIAFPP